MSDLPRDFNPESPEQREIAVEAARDRSDFVTLMIHAYRGELGRTTAWRARIDKTSNWAVVLTATLLTWGYSADSRPHYILLVGMAMVTVFLFIESRRYRVYDIWRSRVRLLEENLLANALDPVGAEHPDWRMLLSEDFRDPKMKITMVEAVTRRLRRIYFPLISVLVGAWIIRLAVFAPPPKQFFSAAAIGSLPGKIVLASVGAFYVGILVMTLWPRPRRAKGELKSKAKPEGWK
jgi:uncharacterized membrane protein